MWLFLFSLVAVADALVVPPSASQFYFSQANWARNATTAISVNAGSYFKISK